MITLQQISILGIAFGVLFLTRSGYRIIDPSGTSRDAYAHLRLMKDFKAAGYRLPDSPSSIAFSGYYSYPFLMHWVLSFLPESSFGRIDQFFSGIMDVLTGVVFISLYVGGVLTFEQLVLALILFIATPEFARSDQAHGKGLSGRKVGMLLTTVTYILFFAWTTTGHVEFLGLTMIVSGLVSLSSLFGMQALTFIAIGVGITTEPTALLLPPAAVVVGIVLSRGIYLEILQTHLSHLIQYAMNFERYHPEHSHPTTTISNLPTVLWDTIKSLYRGGVSKSNLLKIRQITVIRGLMNNPFLVVLAAALIMGTGGSVPEGYVHWALSGVGAFLFTALPPFQFLGEPERYLEFALVPATVIIAVGWTETGTPFRSLVVTTILFGFMILTLYAYLYKMFVMRSGNTQELWDSTIAFLNSVEKGTVVAQPMAKGREVAWKTHHSVIDMCLNAATTEESKIEKDQLFPNGTPHITSNIEWLKETYNPSYVLFDMTGDELEQLSPPRSDPVFENELFQVYSFDSFNKETDR